MIDEFEKGALANTGYRRKQQQDLRAQAAERDAMLLRPLPPQTSSILGKSYRKPTRYRPIQRVNLEESLTGEVGIVNVNLHVHGFLEFDYLFVNCEYSTGKLKEGNLLWNEL